MDIRCPSVKWVCSTNQHIDHLYGVSDRKTAHLLFLVFVYILFFITLINPQNRTVAVSNLTPSLFEQLQNQYGPTLSCACTTISASYKTFVTNRITIHPVCFSSFVGREWVEAFFFRLASLFPAADIRTTAFSHVSDSSISHKLVLYLPSTALL